MEKEAPEGACHLSKIRTKAVYTIGINVTSSKYTGAGTVPQAD